jgi:hypothetical protein
VLTGRKVRSGSRTLARLWATTYCHSHRNNWTAFRDSQRLNVQKYKGANLAAQAFDYRADRRIRVPTFRSNTGCPSAVLFAPSGRDIGFGVKTTWLIEANKEGKFVWTYATNPESVRTTVGAIYFVRPPAAFSVCTSGTRQSELDQPRMRCEYGIRMRLYRSLGIQENFDHQRPVMVPVQNDLRVTRTSVPGRCITTPSRQLSVASHEKPCKRVLSIDLRHIKRLIGLMTVAD